MTQKAIENLEEEISSLEEDLDRADSNGIGTFQLAKKIEEKRKELAGLKTFQEARFL